MISARRLVPRPPLGARARMGPSPAGCGVEKPRGGLGEPGARGGGQRRREVAGERHLISAGRLVPRASAGSDLGGEVGATAPPGPPMGGPGPGGDRGGDDGGGRGGQRRRRWRRRRSFWCCGRRPQRLGFDCLRPRAGTCHHPARRASGPRAGGPWVPVAPGPASVKTSTRQSSESKSVRSPRAASGTGRAWLTTCSTHLVRRVSKVRFGGNVRRVDSDRKDSTWPGLRERERFSI